jgi:hypothetical protein
MRPRGLALALALCGALGALGCLGAAPAAAATVWNLEMHHNQTDFPPGGKAQYWFDLDNVGSSPSSGPIKLTVELPTGLTRSQVLTSKLGFGKEPELKWSCPGAAGDTTVQCETEEGSIPRHSLAHLILEVAVGAPGAPGEELSATATLQGGGAASAVSDEEPTPIDAAPAGFGFVQSAFKPGFFAADGLTPEREAGGHPALLTFPVDFNSVVAPAATPARPLKREAESVRDLSAELPPGFVGAPTAVGECTQAQYVVGACPPSSQVGRFDGSVYTPAAGFFYDFSTGIFNMVHPRGAVTDLAFQVNGAPVHIRASLDPANHYAVTTTVADINETVPPFDGKVTIWGVPADKSHDSERCPAFSPINATNGGKTEEECSTDHPRAPFITMPSQCEAENVFYLREYDSWQNSGLPNANPVIPYTMPGKMTNCDKPRFEPSVSLEPTGRQANTPTGLNVAIHVPQNENPNGLATPPVSATTVTLPPGMTVNPGFADGLQGCSMAQFGIEVKEGRPVPNADPVQCPDNSRIGEVSVSTPLLPKPAEGSMYLARQEENPFGSLLAIYLALHDSEERGVLVKVPLKVSLDPATGQITTTATELPQFPFEDLTLKFRSGARAPLVNPPTCGKHEIAATMSSYARPGEAVNVSGTYEVSEGPGGGACQDVASQRPFDPQLTAGTMNPLAGSYSPLSLRVIRSDADQELSTVEGTGPPGLVASLRGVARCSDAQIAVARARNRPGQGALEQAQPSCPAASQIGSVEAGAGAGPNPIYVPGKIYLAGPYEGAPLSGVAIVPAIAGPVDLGDVVVRAPAFVNPKTAQITIRSDPLPQIVNGVLIRTRDVRIHLDRPGFALNPTSCEPMAINANLTSTEGAHKDDSERFQVADCGSLGFKPKLGLRLKGGTRRGKFPALRATYAPRPGDANLSRLALRFPTSEFIEQGHFGTICTRVQYAAPPGNGAQCPPASIYGHVRVFTQLLDEPLEGPVYLRSSSHNLPDAVFALHGIIDAEVAVRIDSKNGGLRATVEEAPDVPVERAEVQMQGGRKGLFVNSTDICRGKHRAEARIVAQNAKRATLRPQLRAQCGKSKRHAKHKRHRKRRA